MAKLDDIFSSLNINSKDGELQHKHIAAGKKRRPWLEESTEGNTNQNYFPNVKENFLSSTKSTEQQKQSENLNQVDQPHLNQVDQPHLNQVDQPGLNGVEMGSINPIQKSNQMPALSIENLRGNPLRLIAFLFDIVDEHPSRSTRTFSLSEVVKNTGICRESVKTAFKFLCKNALITKLEFKVGVNGWSKYSICEHIYFSILKARTQTGLINQVEIGSINSNSNSNKTTTTTIKNIAPVLNPISNTKQDSLVEQDVERNEDSTLELAWENINISPLANIGFSKNHLLQLKTRNTVEIIQASIDHFAFGLIYNERTKKYENPLMVFMGVLRKGEAWIEPNYKTPQEISMEKLLIKKKEQQERIQKLEEELLETCFLDWAKSLTAEQIQVLTKGTNIDVFRNEGTREAASRGVLNEHFKKNEWPLLRSKVLDLGED